ncbi:MAG TPA: hypothetical protein VJ866_04645 [Pyrinomonadaceae bacterium]|nr:hypothetical protein [Pyrinomonadaceae bacterium]
MQSLNIDDAPRDDGELPEPPRPGQGGYLTVSDAGLFETEEELKNIAAGVAIRGGSVEPALDGIREGYASRIEALSRQLMAVIEALEEGIREARKKIESEGQRGKDLELSVSQQRQHREEVEARLRLLDAEIETSLQEIRKARFEHGKKFFDEQGAYLGGEIELTKNEIIQSLRAKREIAEEIYNLQKDHWFTNKDEYERRARLFDEELKRVEEHLARARTQTARLHRQGITRTTASFLIWVGYISLAGAGGVIGSFFQKRLTDDTEFLSLIFRGLIKVAHVTDPAQSNLSPWGVILAPLPLVALIAVYLFIIGLAVVFMDRRMKKFDPAWDKEREGKDGKKGRARNGRLSLTDRISNYMPTPDVNRKSYRRLLAYFPFILAGALVVWLFAAGIPPGTNPNAPPGKLPDPTAGLAGAYLGIIFILLSTSAALLYTTKIIEPRREMAEAGGGAKGKLAYAKLNWEIVLLAALLIVSLLLTAVLPAGGNSGAGWISVEQANLVSRGAMAIFICLCSLGLAHGLHQRGLFRDEEFFERLRQKYRHLIETHRVGPTLWDAFDKDGPLEEAEPLITKYREAKHMLDEYRMIYELKEIFADDFDDDPAFQKLFRKFWDDPHFSLRSVRLRSVPPGEPRPVDYVVSSDQTKSLLTSRAERRADQDKVVAISGDLARLERERDECKAELERLDRLVGVRSRRKLDVMREYELKRSALVERQEKDILKFQSAYAICRVGYVQLRNELDLPIPPAADSDLSDLDQQRLQ